MAEVYFRKNGRIYHLDYVGDFPSQERLGFKPKNSNRVCTVPAMSTQGTAVYAGKEYTNGRKVYYDTSSPTIAFRKNGTTYYCSKEMKFAGPTSGSIVSTSVSSIKFPTHVYEKDITVNFKLSYISSSSGIASPRYRLSYAVVANEGLSYNLYEYGDPFSGTTRNASYSSVLELLPNGGNPAARIIIRFELWDDLNENLIASKDVRIDGGWFWSDSSSGGGGGSGGE